MIAAREVSRVFPMVALNEACMRLAVGDAIGDISTAVIHVYDVERYANQDVIKPVVCVPFCSLCKTTL